nr:hypothetical protein [Tanacetum cinerariifolium]
HRSQREDGDRGGEHAPRAEAVGHPAAHRDTDGQTQDVAGGDGLQAQRRDVQAGGNAGDGGVEDGGVELLHEQGSRHQPREVAFDGAGVGHRNLRNSA